MTIGRNTLRMIVGVTACVAVLGVVKHRSLAQLAGPAASLDPVATSPSGSVADAGLAGLCPDGRYRLASSCQATPILAQGTGVPPSDDDPNGSENVSDDLPEAADDDVEEGAAAADDDPAIVSAPAIAEPVTAPAAQAAASARIPDGTYECRTWSGNSYIGLGTIRSVNNSLDTALLAKVGATFTGAQPTADGVTVLYTSARGYRESMDCTRR